MKVKKTRYMLKHSVVFVPLALVLFCVLTGTVRNIKAAELSENDVSEKVHGPHLFEQRVYTTADGKLPNLHARFRNHTNYLFVKYGMQLIGYWTPIEKPNTLIYILAYSSREAREVSWKSFMSDPEWKRVWADSKEQAGGAIVTKVESTFLTPTDYSPLR